MHPKLRSALPPSATTAVHAAPTSKEAVLTRMEDRDKAALRVFSPEQPCGASWPASGFLSGTGGRQPSSSLICASGEAPGQVNTGVA